MYSKIKRTIPVSELVVVTYNSTTETLNKHTCYKVGDYRNKTERLIKEFEQELKEKVVQVTVVSVEDTLYEMPVEEFIKHANKREDGKK